MLLKLTELYDAKEMKIIKEVKINSPQGLHARPAAMFVQIVSKYNSEVTVSNGSEKVNGKSIMGILTLGAQHSSAITIEVVGEDAEIVIKELEELLTQEGI